MAALVPIEEYLHTSYRPDRGYADGVWHNVQDGIFLTQDPTFEVPLAEIFE